MNTSVAGQTTAKSDPRKGRRLRRGGVLMVVATAMILAGCSSGSSAKPTGSTGNTTNTTAQQIASKYINTPLSPEQGLTAIESVLGPYKPVSGDTVRGIHGKVITLSGVADESASGTKLSPGVCDGAAARIAAANRAGGVDGYTFNYVGCKDSGDNPTTQLQDVQTAVQQQGAFAMVPLESITGEDNLSSFIEGQHVPSFGGGANPAFCGWNTTAFAFSVTWATSCATNPLPGGVESQDDNFLQVYLKAAHVKASDAKIAIVASQDAGFQGTAKFLPAVAEQMGMHVVYYGAPIPAASAPALSDYAPLAEQLLHTGANVIFPYASSPLDSVDLMTALKSIGYKGQVINLYAIQALLQVPSIATALDGAITPQDNGASVFPSKQMNTITADLKAIHSPYTAADAGVFGGYGSADMFLNALSKVQGPLTAEKLANVMNKGYTYPGFGNAVCSSEWPVAHVMLDPCSAGVIVDAASKSFTPAVNLDYSIGHLYLEPASAAR